MKNRWQIKDLGEVCSFENGDRGENYPSKSVQSTYGIPFINAGHLNEFGIDFQKMNYIPEERFELLGNGKIRRGDLLFCLRGSLGKVACVGDMSEGAIASSLIIVRPNETVLNSFLLAYFRSDLCSEMINHFKNGAAQPNLSAASLKKFKIPVPPLPEQKRIVEILDQAFDSIAKTKAIAEKNLQNAKGIFESYLNEVFSKRGDGWVGTTIGEQITLQRGYDITKNQQQPGDVPVVSSGGIKSFHNKATAMAPGVVIGRKGTLGKVFYLEENFWPHDTTLWVKQFNRNEPRFVYYFFLGLDVTKLDSGTANPALNRNQVHPIAVFWPSPRKQKEIITTLDLLSERTKKLQSIYQNKLTSLEELKKSLLHQAFNGQL